MDRNASKPVSVNRHPLLHVADQTTLAVLVSGCFVAILTHWIWHVQVQGRLIEIDRAGPLTIEFQIQVNEADWSEFTLLPGIGETLSRRIIDYREQHGPFESIDQIERVKGIGPKTIRRIGPYLTVQ